MNDTLGKSLDESEVRSRFAGRLPLLRRVTSIFAEQTPRLLADIRRGIARDDAPAVAHAAHTLKGSLAQLGAARTAEVASHVEEAAKAGGLSGVDFLLEQLEAQTADVQRTLNQVTESANL